MCMNIRAQETKYDCKVMNVTPNGVKIAGRVVQQYDSIYSGQTVEWLKENAKIEIKPLQNLKYNYIIAGKEYDDILYKGVIYTARPLPHRDKYSLLWWIKFNKASYKSTKIPDSLFGKEFDMYEDELIIEVPEVLKKGQGYRFESISNGKSFYSRYNNEKPLIMITRNSLDSIDFDGDSIVLRVYYSDNNIEQLLTDSMIIINHK